MTDREYFQVIAHCGICDNSIYDYPYGLHYIRRLSYPGYTAEEPICGLCYEIRFVSIPQSTGTRMA